MNRRYDNARALYRAMNGIEKIYTEHGWSGWPDVRRNYIVDIRKELKRVSGFDPLEHSIMDGWRTVIDDDDIATGGKDFRILPTRHADAWTDKEIADYIMEEVGYPPITAPWDCTGQRFTEWVSYKRLPIGIVMIHGWGTDL